MNNKKKITMLFLLTATAIGAYAQGNGIAGINEATKMRPLQNSLFKICSFHHIFVPL